MNAPGVSNTATFNALLKTAGLHYSDVETVNLPFPDHVAALKNKSVDASASVEPGPTIAIKNGFAELIKADDQIIPNHEIAALIYSEKFAQKPEFPAASCAPISALCVSITARSRTATWPDPTPTGHLDPHGRNPKSKILRSIANHTDGMNPDGRVNVHSLADDMQFYREQGLIPATSISANSSIIPSSTPS